jgi:2-desacetyl-2-hydroxyethyl bacteriochlorophyllide A dehydrogenase
MKALSITQSGQSQLTSLEKPSCGSDEVLIKLKYVGFCGSDLSTYQGRNPMVSYPRIPGHELSGTIERVGDDVTRSLNVGQAVTVVPYTNCGKCSSCKRGRQHACKNNQTLGVQREGAMTEYVAVPAQKVVLADGLSLEELAIVEPLTVGFHAIARARAESIDTVLVFGCGMIGIGAIAGALSRGAKVIAVDVADEKLDVAKRVGAHHTINSLSQDLLEEVNKITENNGADVVIEAVGNPITYKAAIDVVAFVGRVACIGYAKDDVSFTTKYFVQKELDIMGSRNATAEDFNAVVDYLQKNRSFPLDAVITQKVPLIDSPDAIANWSKDPSQVTKILIDVES